MPEIEPSRFSADIIVERTASQAVEIGVPVVAQHQLGPNQRWTLSEKRPRTQEAGIVLGIEFDPQGNQICVTAIPKGKLSDNNDPLEQKEIYVRGTVINNKIILNP